MREIKFRLWDKRDNKMRYQLDSIRFDTTDYLPFSVSIPSGARNSRSVNDTWIEDDGTYVPNENKEAELMQYTGLKDIDGEEIYESDIVQYEGFHYKEIIKEPVTFKNGIFYGGYQLYPICKYCKVIGNIYENPELLGGS